MKYFWFYFISVLLIICNTDCYSQKLSVGFYSGINISDIHGNDQGGKWEYKTGPSDGTFIDYSIFKVFGIKTGLNYSVLYYEHLQYTGQYNWYAIPAFSSSSSYQPTGFMPYPLNEKMDFSFLTIPLQLRVSIPSKPRLDLAAGIFYSFPLGHSLTNYYSTETPKSDFGYLYSTGISYPLNSYLTGSINAGYLTGRKKMFEYSDFRHGSMDFTFGIAYNGFFRKEVNNNRTTKTDSISDKVYLTYRGGVNISWNSGSFFTEKYTRNTGPSLGFAVNFRVAPNTSLQTGLSYERTGYSLSDSTSSFYRHSDQNLPIYYVDTKVGIDYIVIPALINFNLGRSERVFINTGPYIGIRLNAQVTGEAYNEGRSASSYRLTKTIIYNELSEVIKGNDFGWMFGGGAAIPVSENLAIELGLQYRYGLTDVFNRPDYPKPPKNEREESIIRNGSVTFHVGLRVPVFK